MSNKKYIYKSSVVKIGNTPLGGKYPVRVQSMTNTKTKNVNATTEQSMRLFDAGCDYVRITTPGIKDVLCFDKIKNKLHAANYYKPLIADVHFSSKVALEVSKIADKIRINPGNYYNTKHKDGYLEGIRELFVPFLEECKNNKTAIRIGSNHGSLSERIIQKYGNTAEGMVYSAMEFLEICKEQNFHDVVVSMKSSNTKVMVYANKLMAKMMLEKGYSYPVHLGVTEAGEGFEGIIKSATATGKLLNEGIGDTIRVSLSGDPVKEIPVAKKIVAYTDRKNKNFEIKEPKSESIVPKVIFQNNDILKEDDNKTKLPDSDLLDISQNNPETKDRILYKNYNSKDITIEAAIDFGTYFLDDNYKGIFIKNKEYGSEQLKKLSYAILQATGARITSNEYISCPTCGRTNFDLEKAVKEVKKATSVFSGLKIAIMGCIVNGPGEMADADFGYIGAAKGKVSLYKGKEPVKKNIDEDKAVYELVQLIKKHIIDK